MPKRKSKSKKSVTKASKNVVTGIEEEKESEVALEKIIAKVKNKATKKREAKRLRKKIPREEDIRASFPLFEGKTMHLGTSKGDVANRIIICSDEKVA